ncbi:MAG: hypothetical protein IPH24_03650 [Crocinitomicaceae bacterium]|nr:hypothetical protein [Crocinitomicaceae bacterium]
MEQLLKYHSRIAVIALIFISGVKKIIPFILQAKQRAAVTEHNIYRCTSNGLLYHMMLIKTCNGYSFPAGVYKNTYRKIEVETVNQFFYLNKIEVFPAHVIDSTNSTISNLKFLPIETFQDPTKFWVTLFLYRGGFTLGT